MKIFLTILNNSEMQLMHDVVENTFKTHENFFNILKQIVSIWRYFEQRTKFNRVYSIIEYLNMKGRLINAVDTWCC